MFSIRTVFLTTIVFLAAQTCSGVTDVPDLFLSEAFITYSGSGTVSLLVVPDGNGNPFTEAHDEQGNVADATITLYLRDAQGMPFVLFPHEDMWLETDGGGLVPCTWGLLADDNTDVNGMTWWVNPALAGGHSEGPARVFVNGAPLTSNPGFPLRFNSPDVNGDLVVNLADIAIFAGDFYSGYQFRCDLNGDGVINLADVAILAQHIGAQCP